jgi:hypothetical protein
MNKNETITLIRNAKSGHKRWVENAISLSKGLPLDQSQVPVNATDCVFGQWYYSEGQNLKSFAIFKDIEKYHDALHKTYREIFVLLFEKHEEPSWLSRLFGVFRDVAEEKQMAMREKLQLLEQQSRIIMKKLDELEDLINVMPIEPVDVQDEQSSV